MWPTVASTARKRSHSWSIMIVTTDRLSRWCLGNLSTSCNGSTEVEKGCGDGLIIGGGSAWGRNTQVLFLQQPTLFDNNSVGSNKSDVFVLIRSAHTECTTIDNIRLWVGGSPYCIKTCQDFCNHYRVKRIHIRNHIIINLCKEYRVLSIICTYVCATLVLVYVPHGHD